MAEYNHEKNGPIAEMLHRADAYHFHSGQMTDILCTGYSDRDRSDEPELGPMSEVQMNCRLKYFFLSQFHEMRQIIVKGLAGKWNYVGGVDLLLFPTTGMVGQPIDWTQAAIVRSHRHVGTIFRDVDEMVRTVINLNEAYGSLLHPDQLRPEITDKVIKANALSFLKKVGPDAVHKAIEFFGPKIA